MSLFQRTLKFNLDRHNIAIAVEKCWNLNYETTNIFVKFKDE